jgi:hypothetical protein
MSHVTSYVLVCSSDDDGDDGPVAELNAKLASEVGIDLVFTEVSGHAIGTKGMEARVWIGGGNYAGPGEVLRLARECNWFEPEHVILLYRGPDYWWWEIARLTDGETSKKGPPEKLGKR